MQAEVWIEQTHVNAGLEGRVDASNTVSSQEQYTLKRLALFALLFLSLTL